MSGTHGGSGDPLGDEEETVPGVPPSAFFEAEAEESGAEGGGDDEEGEGEGEENAADLQGFIANDDEVEAEAAAAEAAAGSSTSEDEGGDELVDEDFEVLREAGMDMSQVKQPKRAAPLDGDDQDGPDRQKPRRDAAEGGLEGLDDLDDLFGPEEPQSGLVAALAGLADENAEGGDSDGESVDSFIVEDPAAKRRRRNQDSGGAAAREFGITEEQMQDVMSIFGDTSVLRPIDEIGLDAIAEQDLDQEQEEPETILGASSAAGEAAEAATFAVLAASTAAARQVSEQLVPASVKGEQASYAPETSDLDPDLQRKTYQLPGDKVLEDFDAPERWVQNYHSHPELLSAEGQRQWTDEEHDCESRWIWSEVFSQDSSYWADSTTRATRLVLEMLHEQKLEPVYIVHQLHWQVARALSKKDIWRIFEYDLIWQGVWARYLRLCDWMNNVEGETVVLPDYIKDCIKREVFDSNSGEQKLRDAYDWLTLMHPDEAPPSRRTPGRPDAPSSTDRRILACREAKFDEKLGIRESVDVMTLRSFGITPADLGTNVIMGTQNRKPMSVDGQEPLASLCARHVTEKLATGEAVQDAVMCYLSRLIAADPRIRAHVRQEFWKMCAISTRVTEAGRVAARDAAHAFKSSYRAFHVVNRPASMFKAGDPLFLDILHLQRQGFVTLEYSLVLGTPTEKNADLYQLVMLGQDSEALTKSRQMMSMHFERKLREGNYIPEDKDLNDWKWCEETFPKLEDIQRTREVIDRQKESKDKDKERLSPDEAKVFAGAPFLAYKMNFRDDTLNKIMVSDPIYEGLLKLYCFVEESGMNTTYVVPSAWNNVRKQIISRVLFDELYPMLWSEVQDYLAKSAEEFVCNECARKLNGLVDMQPFRMTDQTIKENKDKLKAASKHVDEETDAEMEDHRDIAFKTEKDARKQGLNSVIVVLPEVGLETVIVATVAKNGDPVDMRQIFKLALKIPGMNQRVHEPGSWEDLKDRKVQEHRDTLKALIKEYKPSVILVAITDSETLRMQESIKKILDEPDVKAKLKLEPEVTLVDPSVPRVVAYNRRVMLSGTYADLASPAFRIAISCARFHQDPWAETCQLWHELPDENGLLNLKLHRLQSVLPKEKLSRAIMRPLLEAAANAGFNVNRVRTSAHLQSIIPFLPGFGPRKAKFMRRCIGMSTVMSREDFVSNLARVLNLQDPLRSPVVANVLPFIRIQPNLLDQWVVDSIPGLDRTRLGEMVKPWAVAFCKHMVRESEGNGRQDDEEEDSVAKDVVARLIRILDKDKAFRQTIQDADWENWDKMAGQPISPDSNLDTLFDMILNEMVTPYEDFRATFAAPAGMGVFFLAVGETDEDFKKGCVVHASVQRDFEVGADPLTSDQNKGIRVSVEVVPCGVRGFFKKTFDQNASSRGTGFIDGCERLFQKNELVKCRVMDIYADRNLSCSLSVYSGEDQWLSAFPLLDGDYPYFIPHPSEDWTKVKLGLAGGSEEQQKEKLKDWVRRPRNIRHANWLDASHDQALKMMQNVPLGNVLFRPSKRHDVIIAMLKVQATEGMDAVIADKCFRSFDVVEKNVKTIAQAFEIAAELEVEGHLYKDFDEIIARHMDPIMENLRVMQEHKRFGLRDGEIIDVAEVRRAIPKFSKGNNTLHYCLLMNHKLPGHGLLIWGLYGRQTREELIEITRDGYSLWLNKFDRLPELLQWFKTVGWRHAHKCRQDFREAMGLRIAASKEKRGPDAMEGKVRKKHMGYTEGLNNSSGGLFTPGGAAPGTATIYAPEAAAGTPAGSRTPGQGNFTPGQGNFGQGYQTPTAANQPGTPGQGGWANPASPAPFRSMAPRSSQAPSTPFELTGGRGVNGPGPATPAGLGRAPPTANGYGAQPQTPAGAFSNYASSFPNQGTPAGAVPQTPAAAYGAAPSTPAGAHFGYQAQHVGPNTPGMMVPQTPTHLLQGRAAPFTPGMPAPFTPAGPAPLTPAPNPQTPGSVPHTPAR